MIIDPRLLRLRDLVEQRSVLRGEFTLASGIKSEYYFDGRRVTHDPEGITLIGELIEEVLQNSKIEAVGGPATGANPMITAVQMVSRLRRRPIGGFFVRNEKKEYGTAQQIEGNFPSKGANVAILDDTITTGGSIQKAIDVVESAGVRVAKLVVVVDRRQGGVESLRARGYEVEALLTAEGEKVFIAPGASLDV